MTPEYLRQCLDYDASTGALTWRERPREHFRTEHGWNTFNAQKAGRLAGCISRNKWGAYWVVRIDKRLYLAHRLIWMMLCGEIAPGLEIDHQDGDGQNNRIQNLRLVTSSGNKQNSALSARNKSGCHGVYWVEAKGKWVAQLWANGEYHHVGTFDDVAQAAAARKAMEQSLGFHPNHGRMPLNDPR